ncbi:MAG: citrate transporter [Clostridia bacterium]|nr:citrate transporter [Clostridia bacterium]
MRAVGHKNHNFNFIKVLVHARDLVLAFSKKNIVMLIACLCATVTCFIVPPDAKYLEYFDLKTLSCLFLVLAVVCALKNIRFFFTIARKIVEIFKNTRMCVLALLYITFIGSMLIANDMALLTFLPLGYLVLKETGKEKYMAYTFIMQNISANLGGMLTPFGNPQNLYLYSKFAIDNLEFMGIMAPPFILSVALITLCTLVFVKKEEIKIEGDKVALPPLKTIIYLLLFALSIVVVFRGVPYPIGLVIIPIVLLFMDRRALLQVDYPLLLTFAFFFIFSGNMARIEEVRILLEGFLQLDTMIASAISCQFISNVPSAILLSQFTTDYKGLLLGVNIGGVGTLISSLASLITLREYASHNPQGVKGYIVKFSIFNFSFLLILIGFMCLLRLF